MITSVELVESPVQPFNVHARVYATDDVPPFASMVLMIETVQFTESAAPPGGPDSWPLHWENETVAAEAGDVPASSASALRPKAATTAAQSAANSRRVRRGREKDLRGIDTVIAPSKAER